MQIYKTTNLVNGKIYVGQDTKSRPSYIGSGKLIRAAIKKYGKENFIKEVLEDNIEDMDLLNEREIFWIAELHACDKSIGYNITKGGKGVVGWHMTDEQRAKLSEVAKKRPPPSI